MDTNQPHIDWDKLLDSLESDEAKGGVLNPTELQLLAELRVLKAEAYDLLNGYQDFDTAAELLKVKSRIGMDAEVILLKKTKLWPKLVGIAAAVAAITFGIWFYTSRHLEGSEATRDLLNYANDIAPGKQGATLTLANGKIIQLSDSKNGLIVGQDLKYDDNTPVISNEERNLLNSEDKRSLTALEMTMSTAKGQTYMVTLPDKSKVWLNAASSITYSASLNERGLRRVKLEGEAYFEVAKNAARPFIVQTGKQEVEVLGTHFNINSYADEPVTKTTLIEGSVKVSSLSRSVISPQGGERILKPNQQSILKNNILTTIPIDAQAEIAWKNNNFVFENNDIQYIMRQVSRWYNVQVIYNEMPTEKFWGSVSRFDNISNVLNILQSAGGVHFKLEGRKLYVSK